MQHIAIIGLGVMGGSFAARLKQLGHEITGIDTNPDTIQYALQHNIIDHTDNINNCSLIIFCLYPTKLKPWLQENKDKFKPGTLILEISGVKQTTIQSIQGHIPPNVELLSIHPMCGRESRGIQHADPTIFDQSNFLIIPNETNTQQNIEKTKALARQLGVGNISTIQPKEHDQMIAFLSQLTHVLAVTLMNTHENGHLVDYTGDSFRDLTRIAKINEDMWAELFLLNKQELLTEMEQFETSFQHFKHLLETEDTEAMKEQFRTATARRKKFDRT